MTIPLNLVTVNFPSDCPATYELKVGATAIGAHALAPIISIYDDAIHLDTPLSLSGYSDEVTETVTLNVYKEDASLQVSDTFTYTLKPDCELVDHIIYTEAKSFDSFSVAVNGLAAQFQKTFNQHSSIYPVGCPLSYTI